MFKNLDELKKKKLYTIVAVILLTAMYVIIFLFSSESGEESSDLSAGIAEWLMKVYDRLFGAGNGNGAVVDAEIFPLEAVIRKMAHFIEYLCIGGLSYSLVLMWYKPNWKGIWFVLLQVFVSGALDEIHQYFIPGRAAMFKDVLIDTAGGLAGIVIVYLWYKVDSHRKVKFKCK